MTPPSPGDALPTPETVGRYELFPGEPAVTTGALGDLRKARIASGPEVGRAVVLRRIRRTAGLDTHAVECLTNAGFSAMELRHPKIAAVLDVVVADAEIALVSEQIGGVPLTALLRPGPDGKRPNVPPAAALRIAVDLLEALDAVCEPWAEIVPPAESEDERLIAAGIHGGVLPDAVLVAAFGETMLLEAGLSGVALGFPAILDHADAVAYRAPEQLEKKGLPDERTDVFTVGILLWELIAGRALFAQSLALPRPLARPGAAPGKSPGDAAQLATLRRKVLGAPIQRLDTMPLLKGKVSKELAAAVARCLERDPGARFQSLRDARTALLSLGAAVGDHPSVAALLPASGAGEEPEESYRKPLASTRPTVPPADGRDTVPPETRRREGDPPADTPVASSVETARALSPATVSEPEGVTQLARAAADLSSVPPTIVESLPPTSVDVESVPPSGGPLFDSSDIESLPPSASLPPVTEVSAVAPPVAIASVQEMESAPPPSISLPPVTAGGDPDAARVPAFPVVASAREDAVEDSPPERPRSPATRGDKRKLVIGVMAAAGLLALAGLVKMLFSGGEQGGASDPAKAARPSESAPATTAALASPKKDEAAVQADVPAAETAPPAAAAEPTSTPPAPAAAPVAPPPGGTPMPMPKKKKTFRPTGI